MKLSDAAQSLFNKLVYTPEKTVPMLPEEVKAVGENGYYKPLVEQVDYLNNNQNLLNPYEQKQFKNVGYETVRNNAMQGLNSGLPSLNNYMDNTGLLSGGLKTEPAKNGFFMDTFDGFRENLNTPFKKENWTPNENKGIGYHLGEGLGSIARGLDTPLLRGGLAYGLTSALGGDNTMSLMQGLNAGVTNQSLRTKNNFYRDALEKQGVDTSNINGWVGDDMYKNYTLANYRNESLRVREAIANSNLEMKDRQELMRAFTNGEIGAFEVAQYLAKHSPQWGINNPEQLSKSNQTRNADTAEEAVKTGQYNSTTSRMNANTNAGRLGLQEDEFEYKKKVDANGGKENRKLISAVGAVEEQINNFENTFNIMPSKVNAYTSGQVRRVSGTQTPAEVKYNAQRTLLFNKIARDLGGEKGVLSDQDIKRIEDALPKLTDSLEQKKAKMSAVKELISIRKNQIGTQNSTYSQRGEAIQKLKNAGFSDSEIQEYIKVKGL